ncbi:MAG TPA: polysaccharide deacetylase family protein [Candidatus Rifleibacterium sp.]|nr:polysaccharide deacetylase family protein [Candidatus Rifleibacterium sp.]HPT47946.1 polysaccharide deacetylase family protein [Candidatus Rifleibacterium sp.]
MHKFNYLNCFVFSVFLALVLAPAAIAGNAVTVDTVATAGEHFPAEKSEVMKYTDPEEIILNDNLAQIGGYFSRPRLLKLLGGSRRVVLTFDDGPHPRTTPQVLEILRQRNIKAIFFVLGVQAQKFPELVKQIHDEGHLIGNHSYSHKNLAQVSSEKMHDEINRTSRLIESITGRRPAFLRPPYGAMNRNVLRAAKTEGMDIVLWTIDPKDWHSKNELSVLRQVDRQMGFNGGDLRGGAILLHDIYPSTVRALGPMLDRLAANEYRVTSIDRLDSSSATFWAAAEPNLSRQAIGRQSFRVENSGNQILINLLREKKKSESSAMAMLKAQRRGNFVLFLAQNS